MRTFSELSEKEQATLVRARLKIYSHRVYRYIDDNDDDYIDDENDDEDGIGAVDCRWVIWYDCLFYIFINSFIDLLIDNHQLIIITGLLSLPSSLLLL